MKVREYGMGIFETIIKRLLDMNKLEWLGSGRATRCWII
ncbi:hypothetical protein HNQ65_004855 [Prosthecobacter vanneervenii]|uniref:Uncharacterized protein n=1 Tax=Prosthecobacter vanneervenii TaxID=48466 RepID=A0A7W7YFI9_9BACT|nr:hypothetical protein [Prosthecobacter vanneervenii]